MAEIIESGNKNMERYKRRSTRIDMTPLVDLGFLLVTFFIFTTTLNKANTMQLLMPSEDITLNIPQVPQSEVLVLLIGKNDRIFWYNPDEDRTAINLSNVGYGKNGIRKVIQDEKKRVSTIAWAPGAKAPRKLTVIIKPTAEATYANFVDILDEMNINDITKHITVDPNPEELKMINTQLANAK